MDGCGACDATDELLYNCEECGGRYCAWHAPPSFHECDVDDGTVTADEWFDDAVTADQRASESTAAVADVGGSPRESASPESDVGTGDPGESDETASISVESAGSGRASASTSRAPRDHPDDMGRRPRRRRGTDGVDAPTRPGYGPESGKTREQTPARAETFGDWLRQQTYVTLAVKTGILAVLLSGAFYFGLFLTMTGLVRIPIAG